jgi:hypothetical protein
MEIVIGAAIGLLTGFYFERRGAKATRVVKGLLAKTENVLDELRLMLERCVDERLGQGDALPSSREEPGVDDSERTMLVGQLNAVLEAQKQKADNEKMLFGSQKPETIAEIDRLKHRLAGVRSMGQVRPKT